MRAMKTALLAALLLVSTAALAETAGGISWKPPISWKVDPPRQMRVATYKIAPAKGDADEAELAVFYFGKGQGGTIDDNMKRWAGQFESAKPPVMKKEKLAGFDVSRIEVKGTYGAAMGPMAPASSSAPKANYALLGAIVEAPEGSVFFKLTGPQKTVESARLALDKMLKSITQ